MDGLRAVAVLGVVAYHLGLNWAKGGLLGVDVFFVLSGYLITDLLLAERQSSGVIALKRFWQRRARRLLPALLLMLAVSVAFATLFDHPQLPGMRSDLLPAIFYYSNWWDIYQHVSYFASFGPSPAFNHLWSLAVEEQFYLIWPLILLVVLRFVRSRRALLIGISVAAAASAIEMGVLYSPLTDPTRVYDGTDTRAFALFIGAALAVALPRSTHFIRLTARGRWVIDGVGAAALVVILAFFWLAGEYSPFVYRGGMLLLSVATAVLIAVCIHPDATFGRVLGAGPLRWIGERSYAMYLWQLPVIVLTTPNGASHPEAWRDVLQVLAVLALSAASWRWVEDPVRHGALGRLWERLRQSGWLALRPTDRRGWMVAGGAGVGSLICLLGLTGAVSGALGGNSGPENSILPPKHGPTTTTATTATTTATTTSQVSTTTATTLMTATTTTTTPPPAGLGVTAIGDSVMVDAAPYLEQMLPTLVIDAQVGQQLTQVQSTLPTLKADGDIGDEVILELGTNGYYSVTQLQALLTTMGPLKRLVLVNTRETRQWEQAVNQTIATVAQSWPSTTLVDWYADRRDKPQYFYTDGIHLNPTGAKVYAGLIVSALETPPPPPPTTTTVPPTTTTTAPVTTTTKPHSKAKRALSRVATTPGGRRKDSERSGGTSTASPTSGLALND